MKSLTKVQSLYFSGIPLVAGLSLLVWDKFSIAYCLLVGAAIFTYVVENLPGQTVAATIRDGGDTAPVDATPTQTGEDNGQLEAIHRRLDELQTSLKVLAGKLDAPDRTAEKAVDAIASQMDAALKNAREQVERRDQVNEKLVATLSKASVQRTLARFAQTLELARAVAAKVTEGKSSGADAMEFVLGDLESVLADNNVRFISISPGEKVADLPPGSFTPIAAVDADNPTQAGTVKEARTAAYFIDDGDGQRRFIAPAKVIVYKARN